MNASDHTVKPSAGDNFVPFLNSTQHFFVDLCLFLLRSNKEKVEDGKHEYDGNEEALIADITSFAKERCAPYEVPKLFEFIEELPLTAVGKVDKKVLRK